MYNNHITRVRDVESDILFFVYNRFVWIYCDLAYEPASLTSCTFFFSSYSDTNTCDKAAQCDLLQGEDGDEKHNDFTKGENLPSQNEEGYKSLLSKINKSRSSTDHICLKLKVDTLNKK